MSNSGVERVFSPEWMKSWADKVNKDRVLRVVGRFFTAKILVSAEDTDASYLLVVRNGQIEKIANPADANMFGWQFALRAPRTTWANFAQEVPPQLFNDILAMVHGSKGGMKLEGDTLAFFQNLRTIGWMFAIMRQA